MGKERVPRWIKLRSKAGKSDSGVTRYPTPLKAKKRQLGQTPSVGFPCGGKRFKKRGKTAKVKDKTAINTIEFFFFPQLFCFSSPPRRYADKLKIASVG